MSTRTFLRLCVYPDSDPRNVPSPPPRKGEWFSTPSAPPSSRKDPATLLSGGPHCCPIPQAARGPPSSRKGPTTLLSGGPYYRPIPRRLADSISKGGEVPS